jgi:hypothetical protein
MRYKTGKFTLFNPGEFYFPKNWIKRFNVITKIWINTQQDLSLTGFETVLFIVPWVNHLLSLQIDI